MSETPNQAYQMSGQDRVNRAVSGLQGLVDLIGSCDDLHCVHRDNLTSLLQILVDELKTMVL